MKKENFKWWETTIACDRMQEDGSNRQVKEHYLLRANSFTDAEKKSMTVAAETAASAGRPRREPSAAAAPGEYGPHWKTVRWDHSGAAGSI